MEANHRCKREEIRSDQKKKKVPYFVTYFLDDNSSADRVRLEEPTNEPQSSDSNVKWASYGQNTQKI